MVGRGKGARKGCGGNVGRKEGREEGSGGAGGKEWGKKGRGGAGRKEARKHEKEREGKEDSKGVRRRKGEGRNVEGKRSETKQYTWAKMILKKLMRDNSRGTGI